jgi:anti-sigma regulatory factor (Ser/Thr protein kinase)
MAHTCADFEHQALLYAGDDEFVEATARFVRAGVDQGEPALVMAGHRKLDLLREELGAQAEGVSYADMEQVGANPARIIPAWRDFADQNEGRPMRGVGEPIWADRSAAELVECQRHEALINLAFADVPDFLLLCPYDTSALSDDVIHEARRSHPYIVHHGNGADSDDWTGLGPIAGPFDTPLPEPAAEPRELTFSRTDLPRVRDFVAGHAASLGSAAANLVMAANEAAANSVRHGGGEGVVRVWDGDDALVCEVRDEGRFEDPLVGRMRPEGLQDGGYGVWLMNQLCDLVQIRSFEDGSVVRLHVRN